MRIRITRLLPLALLLVLRTHNTDSNKLLIQLCTMVIIITWSSYMYYVNGVEAIQLCHQNRTHPILKLVLLSLSTALHTPVYVVSIENELASQISLICM